MLMHLCTKGQLATWSYQSLDVGVVDLLNGQQLVVMHLGLRLPTLAKLKKHLVHQPVAPCAPCAPAWRKPGQLIIICCKLRHLMIIVSFFIIIIFFSHFFANYPIQ